MEEAALLIPVPLYLADTSIWLHVKRSESLRELLAERLEDDEIATCIPVALEVLSEGFDDDELDVWEHIRWLPMGQREMDRALELRLKAGILGRSSRALAYMVAACAEAAGPDVVVWHCDPILMSICWSASVPQEAGHEPAESSQRP